MLERVGRPGRPGGSGGVGGLDRRLRVDGNVFVGRARELAELADAMDGRSGQAGGLFLLSGEGGIGKTRLADEAARAAKSDGGLVLWGHCCDGAATPAYWPWIQILHGLAGTADAPATDEAARLGARLSAPLEAASPSDTLSTEQFWLMAACADLLTRSAADTTMVLVLDDMHRAEGASLAMLEFLAAKVVGSLVIVCAFRDVDAYADPHVRAVFGRLARLGRSVPLRGLSNTDVDEILARRFGLCLPEAAIDDLREWTGGNPWLVEELVRLALSEASAHHRAGGSFRTEVPEAIRAGIRNRLDNLSPETRELLVVAAALGGDLSFADLGTVAGLDEESVLDLLGAPVLRSIISPDDAARRFRFSPPVVGAALYDDLDLAERRRLRRVCATGPPIAGASWRPHHPTLAGALADACSALHSPNAPNAANGDVLTEPAPAPSPPVAAPESTFRREGEYWTIGYAGATIHLKDAKGFRYLALLLARPHVEVHVGDLPLVVAGMTRNGGDAPEALDSGPGSGLSPRRIGDAGEMIDATAKAAYRARLEELRDCLSEAEELHHDERMVQIEEEMAAIAHELAASVGLGGRDRRAASAAERARVNVTRTIRAAIDKIGQALPVLGQHLSLSIKTGTFCCYMPDPAVRPSWQL